MALGAIASGLYGISKTIGFDPIKKIGGLFGGGGDKSDIGSPGEPGSVVYEIDTLDRANNAESISLAKQSLQMKLQGRSDRDIASFIALDLGYPFQQVWVSQKWRNISNALNREANKHRELQRQQRPSRSLGVTPAPSQVSAASSGGLNQNMLLIIIAAVIAAFAFLRGRK